MKSVFLSALLLFSPVLISEVSASQPHPRTCRPLQREYDNRKKEIARYHREIKNIRAAIQREMKAAIFQNRQFNEKRLQNQYRELQRLTILTDELFKLNNQTFVRLSNCYLQCQCRNGRG